MTDSNHQMLYIACHHTLNEMITAIIIDNEQHCIDKLSYLLAQYHKSSVRLLSSVQSVEEGVAAIQQLQPDLVFLDVQLNGKTGFDVLKQFDDISFAVIFTTAFEKYAIQAIKFSAVDYLLKPVDTDELKAAIDKLKGKLSKEDTSIKIDSLLTNLYKDAASKRIVISSEKTVTVYLLCDIIRCESNINYTNFYLKDGTHITASKTLKEFDEILSDYDFFRVHNSHLINLAYVKKYDKLKSVVLMTNNDKLEIPVSTRRKDEFLQKLANL